MACQRWIFLVIKTGLRIAKLFCCTAIHKKIITACQKKSFKNLNQARTNLKSVQL